MRLICSRCCARATTGQMTAPPNKQMNARRLMPEALADRHRNGSNHPIERALHCGSHVRFGKKQTYAVQHGMSALPLKATSNATYGTSVKGQ